MSLVRTGGERTAHLLSAGSKAHSLAQLCHLALLLLSTDALLAQQYANKPVRIVTAAVGGAQDFTARMIAQALAVSLNQQVIVENRGALVAIDVAAASRPDGYTLLVAGTSLWLRPILEKASYDPLKAFVPICMAVREPTILVVHPALAVSSVQDLIALARSKPGALNYASGVTGGPPNVAAELFKAMAGLNVVRVNYKGTGPALNDLVAGHVQLMFAAAAAATPHIAASRLRALAVTSAVPSTLLPDLPTVAASGLSGYEAESRLAVLAPAGVPSSIVARLSDEIVRILGRSDVRERFLRLGSEPVASTSTEAAAVIKSEIDRMSKIFEAAGIRANRT